MARPSNDRLKNAPLEPVSTRQTLQDAVYLQLSHALMTGHFDPGQMLTISALSKLVNTSHMPVREALRRLAAQSALEIASTGTAVVPVVSRVRLDDLCSARVIVEGAAAALATPHVDRRSLAALLVLAEDHVKAFRDKDIPAILATNQAFHFSIYRAARSPVLDQLIQSLWLRFGPYLRVLTQHLRPQLEENSGATYSRYHFDMIGALKAGDAAAVRGYMEADIRSTHALLQSLYPADEHGTPALRRG